MEQNRSIRSIIREELSKYQEFFQSALDKFGVKSPNELSDEKKKEFFDYVDKNYDGKKESKNTKLKKMLKEEFHPQEYRWDFSIAYAREFEDVLEQQDPVMLNFPHTIYYVEDQNEYDIADAAISTDGNSSFVVVNGFDREEAIYKVFKDWKLALQYFKKLIRLNKIKVVVGNKVKTI